MITYIAGWNMPGYLTESEPAEFDSLEDARAYLINELQFVEDQAAEHCDEDRAETASHAMQDVNLMGAGDSVECLGLVYWIAEGDA